MEHFTKRNISVGSSLNWGGTCELNSQQGSAAK